MRLKYSLGDVYGDYTIIDHVKVACGRPTKVKIRCICGYIGEKILSSLVHGRYVKCSHVSISKQPWYKCYWHMKERCYNNADKEYHNYGGRGITICDEWLSDAWEFGKWAINSGYSPDLQIDRIDNDGNYGPNNCRWVTRLVNCNNRSTSRKCEIDGRVDTTANFCREFGISYSKVVQYRRYHNTTDDEAIKHYLAIKEIEGVSGKQPTLVDICRQYGLNYGNVKSYRHKHGCSTDEAIKYYLIKRGDLN